MNEKISVHQSSSVVREKANQTHILEWTATSMHREGKRIAFWFLTKRICLVVVALVGTAATLKFSGLVFDEVLLSCIYGLMISGLIFLSWFIRSFVLFTIVTTSTGAGPSVVLGSSSMAADQGFAMLLILSCVFLGLVVLVSLCGNSKSLRSSRLKSRTIET